MLPLAHKTNTVASKASQARRRTGYHRYPSHSAESARIAVAWNTNSKDATVTSLKWVGMRRPRTRQHMTLVCLISADDRRTIPAYMIPYRVKLVGSGVLGGFRFKYWRLWRSSASPPTTLHVMCTGACSNSGVFGRHRSEYRNRQFSNVRHDENMTPIQQAIRSNNARL